MPDAGGELGVSLAALAVYVLKPSARDDYVKKYRLFVPGWRTTSDDAMAVATAILMVSRSRALFDSERAVAAIVAELGSRCDVPARRVSRRVVRALGAGTRRRNLSPASLPGGNPTGSSRQGRRSR